jgi:hypothetical protein
MLAFEIACERELPNDVDGNEILSVRARQQTHRLARVDNARL